MPTLISIGHDELQFKCSCAQVRQYRIPDGSDFMKFSVRIPILNFRKYSAQVQVIPENSEHDSESIGILVLHSDSQTYATDELENSIGS